MKYKAGSGVKKGRKSYGGKSSFKSAGKCMECPRPMKDFQKTHRA